MCCCAQPLVTRHPPLSVVGTSIIVGSLSFLPLLPHAVTGLAALGPGQWLWLVFLGVGTTVVPYIIWFGALRSLSAGRLGMYMYLVPLTALAWSAALLGQVPSLMSLLGAAAILAGVVLTQLPVQAFACGKGEVPAWPLAHDQSEAKVRPDRGPRPG